MEVVLQSIVQLRAILLIACAAGMSIFLFGGLMSLRDLERVSFRLERTSVLRRTATYFLRATFFLLLGAGIFLITERYRASTTATSGAAAPNSVATPLRIIVTPLPTADLSQAQSVAQNVAGATPNADPLNMPTPSLDESALVVVTATPLPGSVDALPTFTPEPATQAEALPTLPPPDTPTPFAIPTATPAPTAAEIAALPVLPAAGEATPVVQPLFEGAGAPITADAACGETARLTQPKAGEAASAAYDLVGSAVFAGGVYRLEIIPAGESVWRHLWEAPAAVTEASLMPTPLQTALFPNGTYFLRMLVLGSNGDEVARCTTSFEIRN